MTSIISGRHTSFKEPILVNPLFAHPHGSLVAGLGTKPAWIQRHSLFFVYSHLSGTFHSTGTLDSRFRCWFQSLAPAYHAGSGLQGTDVSTIPELCTDTAIGCRMISVHVYDIYIGRVMVWPRVRHQCSRLFMDKAMISCQSGAFKV